MVSFVSKKAIPNNYHNGLLKSCYASVIQVEFLNAEKFVYI